ncbi:DUF305 domain-containing protein [Clostridium sp.]|uniref:DUF305 domain-containing protein n=1 Tax=Clostridium sp. TaxID=1506 RepID=UPI003F39C7FA
MNTKIFSLIAATIISSSLISPAKIPKTQKISTYENSQVLFTSTFPKFHKKDSDLKQVSLSGDLDLDFIDQMLSQHLEATHLSKEILKYTKNDSIKEVSKNIVSSLDSQLPLMKGLLTEFKKHPNVNEKLEMSYISDYMSIMAKMDKGVNKLKKTGNLDIDYINEIILYEEATLKISKSILKYTKNPSIKAIAEEILKNQSQNLNDLKEIEKTINK